MSAYCIPTYSQKAKETYSIYERVRLPVDALTNFQCSGDVFDEVRLGAPKERAWFLRRTDCRCGGRGGLFSSLYLSGDCGCSSAKYQLVSTSSSFAGVRYEGGRRQRWSQYSRYCSGYGAVPQGEKSENGCELHFDIGDVEVSKQTVNWNE